VKIDRVERGGSGTGIHQMDRARLDRHTDRIVLEKGGLLW
jgi:hypothetical protein